MRVSKQLREALIKSLGSILALALLCSGWSWSNEILQSPFLSVAVCLCVLMLMTGIWDIARRNKNYRCILWRSESTEKYERWFDLVITETKYSISCVALSAAAMVSLGAVVATEPVSLHSVSLLLAVGLLAYYMYREAQIHHHSQVTAHNLYQRMGDSAVIEHRLGALEKAGEI